MHRDADGASLIGDGAGDGLPDPPRGVGREFVAAAPFELVDGLHQADVAFLNQVEELQAAVRIFLRDGNDEAKVGFDQFLLRLLGFHFAADDHLQHPLQFGGIRFGDDFDFAKFLPARFQFLAGFGENVGLRGLDAALELDDFALEGLNALDRLAHLVDQALLLERIEIDFADAHGHFHARAAQREAGAEIGALVRARPCFEFLGLLHRKQVKLADLVDFLQRFAGLGFDLLFGELFVVELNDFLDGARAAAQIFADAQQFFQNDRRARDRLEDEQLPALDALGNGNFALAREQRNGAHLAEIHADGIVRLLERARGEVQLDESDRLEPLP